jgi:hypothetical protein
MLWSRTVWERCIKRIKQICWIFFRTQIWFQRRHSIQKFLIFSIVTFCWNQWSVYLRVDYGVTRIIENTRHRQHD